MAGSSRGTMTPYQALVGVKKSPAPSNKIETVFHQTEEVVTQFRHGLTDDNQFNREQRDLERAKSFHVDSFLTPAGKRVKEEKKVKAKQDAERKEKKEAEDKAREQEMLIEARRNRDILLAKINPRHPLIQPDAAPSSQPRSESAIDVVTPSSVNAASSEPRPHPYAKLVINTASPTTQQTFEVQSPKPEKASTSWCPKLSACMSSISSTLFSCFNSSSSVGLLDDDYELMNPPNSPGNK